MSFANAGLLDWIFGSSEDDVSIENSTLYERTATTETFKNPDGTMTITLYSGIRFIEEDDTWKKIEDARSLKNSGINCVVKKDSKDDPDVECLDFNYTSIKVDVKDKKSYPIKIYSKNKTTEKDSTSETKDTDSKDSTNLILSITFSHLIIFKYSLSMLRIVL